MNSLRAPAASPSRRPSADRRHAVAAARHAVRSHLRLRGAPAPQDEFLARDGVAHDGEVASRLGLTGIPVAPKRWPSPPRCNWPPNRRPPASFAPVLGRRRRLVREAETLGDAGQLRRGDPSPAPDGDGHRLLRQQRPLRPAAALDARPRRAARRGQRRVWQRICSDHTPVDAKTASNCRLPKPLPGATGLELLLPLTLLLGAQAKLPLVCRRWPASLPTRPPSSGHRRRFAERRQPGRHLCLRPRQHREYIFSLVFRFDEKNPVDRSRVKKLVGDDGQNKDGDPGISTPLRLKITLIGSGSEEPVFDQEIQSLRLRSWGGNFFSKHIAYVRLKPGHYRIRVQSLKDVPELGGTKTDFAVGYYAKSTPIR
jgi:hypothetical protein